MKRKLIRLLSYLLKPLAFILGFYSGFFIFLVFVLLYMIYSDSKPGYYSGYMDIVEGELETSCVLTPYNIPHYSIAYSEERFDKVEEGMSIQEVLDLLGYPLSKHYEESTNEETWVYGNYNYRFKKRSLARDILFKDLKVIRIVKINTNDL